MRYDLVIIRWYYVVIGGGFCIVLRVQWIAVVSCGIRTIANAFQEVVALVLLKLHSRRHSATGDQVRLEPF